MPCVLEVVKLVADYISCPPAAGAGGAAHESQAACLFALSQVCRSDRRSLLQAAAWRAAASAERCLTACWRRNHVLETRRLCQLLRQVPELDQEQALHLQVRRLVDLRRTWQELLQRAVTRDPGLLPWLRQPTARQEDSESDEDSQESEG
jgi:hypothetical protein